MRYQTLAITDMAKLAGVSREQLVEWIDEGLVPVLRPEPDPILPQTVRIENVQVLLIRALRDGKTIEEGRRAVMDASRDETKWDHRPPPKTPQERLAEQRERDRSEMFQKLRRGA